MGEVELDLTYIAIVLGSILLSMTLHEAMHAFVSYWLGDDTAKRQGRLTLNPIKHIDPFLTILLPLGLALIGAPIFGGARPVPFNPDRVKWDDWGAALVALGGPLTNFVLAFIAFGVWALVGGPDSGLLAQILLTFVGVNLGFFVFNILPIPPLDGSRVLYALAPEFVRSGMRFIERYGLILVFAIVLVASVPLGRFMAGAINFFIDVFSLVFRVGSIFSSASLSLPR
jgi:Zn-dependent protease